MNNERNLAIIITIAVVIVFIYSIYYRQINRFVKKNILNNNTDKSDSEKLLFIDKVKQNQHAFDLEVRRIAIENDINPDALMFWMDFESAGTFSPSVKNPYTGATGLIQFMPKTAIALGTTTDELAKMDNINQLYYVEKYIKQTIKERGKLNDWLDVYLMIFYPASIGKPDTYQYPLGITPQNPAFDLIKDGAIFKSEIRDFFIQRIYKLVPTMYYKYFNLL